MEEDISYYDRQGIMPSPKVKTLDEYLLESEVKLATMRKVHNNPESYFGSGASVYLAEGRVKDHFVGRFETEPIPNLSVEKANMGKALSKIGSGAKISNFLSLAKASGSILSIEGMQFPFFDKSTTIDKSEVAIHETVHAIRSQWEKYLVNKWFTGFEEMIAYTSNIESDLAQKMFPYVGVIYSAFEPIIKNTPLYLLSGLCIGTLGAIEYGVREGIALGVGYAVSLYAIALGINMVEIMPNLISYNLLNTKAKKEGLNMDYLILRTNSTELSIRRPLEEQIASKEGVRWDIIRNKYGIAKSSSLF